MVNKLTKLDWAALALLVIGGLNWGLVGLIGYDVVIALLGSWPLAVNIVYLLVGVAAVYLLVIVRKFARK